MKKEPEQNFQGHMENRLQEKALMNCWMKTNTEETLERDSRKACKLRSLVYFQTKNILMDFVHSYARNHMALVI